MNSKKVTNSLAEAEDKNTQYTVYKGFAIVPDNDDYFTSEAEVDAYRKEVIKAFDTM